MTTESKPAFDLVEQHKSFDSLLRTAFFADRTRDLLTVQADFLLVLENAITEWLNRRHEAIIDTQRLVSRISDTQDPTELWKAQQDWITNELRRLAADAAGYHSAATQMIASVGQRISGAAQAGADARPGDDQDATKPVRTRTAGERLAQDSTH